MAGPKLTVDGYLAALTHPWRAHIQALRDTILRENPGLTEHIKWNAPSFCDGGEDRVTFRISPKGEVALVFHRGAKVKGANDFRFFDTSGLIVWAAVDRGVVTFASERDIEGQAATVARLVGLWVTATRR